MALPLKDLRLGVPESVDIWLDAVAIANNADKAQIAREVLQEWADKKHHEFTVAHKRLRANGLQTELPGFEMEDAGTTRKARR